jgi:hypothetical protein
MRASGDTFTCLCKVTAIITSGHSRHSVQGLRTTFSNKNVRRLKREKKAAKSKLILYLTFINLQNHHATNA